MSNTNCIVPCLVPKGKPVRSGSNYCGKNRVGCYAVLRLPCKEEGPWHQKAERMANQQSIMRRQSYGTQAASLSPDKQDGI